MGEDQWCPVLNLSQGRCCQCSYWAMGTCPDGRWTISCGVRCGWCSYTFQVFLLCFYGIALSEILVSLVQWNSSNADNFVIRQVSNQQLIICLNSSQYVSDFPDCTRLFSEDLYNLPSPSPPLFHLEMETPSQNLHLSKKKNCWTKIFTKEGVVRKENCTLHAGCCYTLFPFVHLSIIHIIYLYTYI